MAIRPTRPTATTVATPAPTTPARADTSSPTTTRPSVADPGAATGPTLALNFRVSVSNREIAVSRISPLELAADFDGLKQLAGAGRAGTRVWAAPALPGRVVLTRALDGDRTFFDWRREARDGKPATRTVTIRQFDRANATAVNAWQLVNAWPLRWTGPAFDALDGGVAFEEIELVYIDLNWL